MNGAQSLLRTLVDGGVDTCFMNPGTSEMHFVAALDSVPEMRGVLALFEGVATGAADGYGRMADRPASVLLHLGPGLGNGIANLHNARRAGTPLINVVGDHAIYHKRYDAPLESDIDALAGNVSGWTRRSMAPGEVGADAADAISAAIGPPGQVATLILPADVSWSEGGVPATRSPAGPLAAPSPSVIAEVVDALRSGQPCALLVGGRGCRAEALSLVGAIGATCGAKLLSETFPSRLERGAGRVMLERLAYLGEMAVAQMEGLRHLILVDTKSPVSFFAYPGKPSDLVPEGVLVHSLAGPGDDVLAALRAVVDAVGAKPAGAGTVAAPARPDRPSGRLDAAALGQAISSVFPDDVIVCDESNTSGLFIAGATAGCGPHDWLSLTGGAIGIGLPLATGAAVAAPGRRVLALQADGSAMYTIQALWTMAREALDVTTVIISNRSYAILNMELQRVGAEAGGSKARAMLDLSNPDLDFVSLSEGMGVPATKATTAEELVTALERSFATPGPSLVEAVIVR